jgi:phosphohistidine phosphatase SixA
MPAETVADSGSLANRSNGIKAEEANQSAVAHDIYGYWGVNVRRRDDWATRIFFLPVLLLILSGCMTPSVSDHAATFGAARYVFLVRHAERYFDSQEDPPLTPQGEARAQALAATLRDAGVTAIITTQWRRTRDTAKPLATLLRIVPEVIPVHEGKAVENVQEVAAAVRRHRDETVLVVGHITVTGVIAALGGPRLPTICENVFSDLFVFTPAAGDEGLVHLRYGAAEDISARCR